MITARERSESVVVQVSPGGALRGLTLDERALRLGRHALAARVLEMVDKATAAANAAALHTLADDLARLDQQTLVALGVGQSAEVTEAAEDTTQETWSV
ncbi:MAG: YbaB/EbfC family DNA-binding protein [Thermocrispum sp.]